VHVVKREYISTLHGRDMTRFRTSYGTIGDEIRGRIAAESAIVARAMEWRSRTDSGAGECQAMGYCRCSRESVESGKEEQHSQALSGITSGFSP